jgi:hypothetical protein
MKIPVIGIALAGVAILAGCGNGSSNDPAATISSTNVSANASTNLSAVPGPTSLPGNSSSSTPPSMSIDPPSPAIAMSAGVTETVDPPNPASAPAATMFPPADDTTSVAAQQLTPVVHYPPDPSGTND